MGGGGFRGGCSATDLKGTGSTEGVSFVDGAGHMRRSDERLAGAMVKVLAWSRGEN